MIFLYVREATEGEIKDAVKGLLKGSVGRTYRLTVYKVRWFMRTRMGLVSDPRHVSAVVRELAKEEGWERVVIRYHASSHAPCVSYVVRM